MKRNLLVASLLSGLLLGCSSLAETTQSPQEWGFAVEGVQYQSAYKDQYDKTYPAKGRWAIANVKVTNLTKNGIQMSSNLYVSKLIDAKGSSYEVSEVDPLNKIDLGETFFPSEDRTIQLYFDIPKNFQPQTLLIDSVDPVQVKLK